MSTAGESAKVLSDEEWLEEAGRRGLSVVMPDASVSVPTAQPEAVSTYKVGAFGLANRDLSGAEQAHA